MKNVLIGHTGFVGGNLVRQTTFEGFYNSANIEAIAGQRVDTLVCCGAPAEKWKAVAQPDADRENIQRLIRCLGRVTARRVILISTVDVYAHPVGVDEDSPVGVESQSAYGRHRHELERAILERFEAVVIRLPGLFGTGLKKNAIYDLLHRHRLEYIHRDSVYQFYDLAVLWRDVQTALSHGIRVVNFATEPIAIAEVASAAFGLDFTNVTAAAPARYDVRTRFADRYGASGGYLYDKAWVVKALRRYVLEEASRTP